MALAGPTAITYVGLPISAGGAHSLGRMPVATAYERTLHFLSSCTRLLLPPTHRLLVSDIGVPLRPPERAELRRRFGDGDLIDLQPEQIPDALGFLADISPPTAKQMGGLWLTVDARFRILDPQTGGLLPGQDPERYAGVQYQWDDPLGSSRLALSLHSRATLAVDLCLPDADDAVLDRVLPWLQTNLPCKLSSKHWMHWTPTKTGSFKGRKMASPLHRSEPPST
ncbi:MAG: hypothetical protein IE926_03515 [Micrococcales bacterium]|nr:hypothetical protein [Micrococcales bacterium]